MIQPCATARVLKGAVKGSSAERSPRCKTTGSHHVKLKQMLIMWLSLSLSERRAAVTVVGLCLDGVIGPLQACKTMIKSG